MVIDKKILKKSGILFLFSVLAILLLGVFSLIPLPTFVRLLISLCLTFGFFILFFYALYTFFKSWIKNRKLLRISVKMFLICCVIIAIPTSVYLVLNSKLDWASVITLPFLGFGFLGILISILISIVIFVLAFFWEPN